ncbi:hypothetical protein Tco_0553115 [Tanacetum coccineum]
MSKYAREIKEQSNQGLGLGASVNIMSESMLDELSLANLKHANIIVEMADKTRCVSQGIVENVLDNMLGGQIREKTLTEEQDDPEKCGETKERAIIRAMVNKLPKEWIQKLGGNSRDRLDSYSFGNLAEFAAVTP